MIAQGILRQQGQARLTRRETLPEMHEHEKAELRAQWSSEPAFVFSMAAAAVGLGNLWRFPYMVGENGGGAFIAAYLIALAIVALPVMMLEIAAGRIAKGSVVGTYRRTTRLGAAYGWLVVLLTIIITSYYHVITGWTLGYPSRLLRDRRPARSAWRLSDRFVWA